MAGLDCEKLNSWILLEECNIVIYIVILMTRMYFSYIFAFVHSSWPTVPQTLGISLVLNDQGVFCYVNVVTFGKHLRRGLIASGADL